MNNERDDGVLLQEFVDQRSEGAFAELVQRHVDLVYSVALRQLRGNAFLARDVTQAVFCELARNARKLRGHRALSGWLYTTTRFVASRLSRSETRRAAREQAFAMNTTSQASPDMGWNDVENLLDDAMQDLSTEDREAVLLRFFRNETFGSIGAVFGSSENAARMRVERALEKLRTALNRRGVTCPSAVLSGLIAANAISSAPAGLAAAITAPALLSAASVSAVPQVLSLLNFMTATKAKVAIAAIALMGTTTGWIVAERNSTNLKSEIVRLRAAAPPSPTEAALDRQGESVDPDELARLRAQQSELMRLRAEVTELRKQARERAATPPPSPRAEPSKPVSDEEALQQLGMAKLTVAKSWGLAMYKFVRANNGQMPKTFQEALDQDPELSEELLRNGGLLNGDEFEITFQGSWTEIENPAEAIIMREKEPYHVDEDGVALRTYLFADGHTEIHRARGGDFAPWESRKQPRLKSPPQPETPETPGQ